MKKAILILVGLMTIFASTASWATVHVRGHYRSNGTYVRPHIRSNPDGNPYNNLGSWSYLDKTAQPNTPSPYNPASAASDDIVV